MSQNVGLTDEQLDELFLKEVRSVASIVENHPNNKKLAITFERWLKIFKSATDDEKFARNWMLLQMHQQLNDQNALSYPFTDARSSEHDLTTLHQMSVMHLQLMASDEGDCSGKSDCMELSEDNLPVNLEIANKQLIEENESLMNELQELQSMKESLLQSRQNILNNESDGRSSGDTSMYGEDMKYMKEMLACNITKTLKIFDQYPHPNYFASLFALFCDDHQDRMYFEQLDIQLGGLLRDYIKHHKRHFMLNKSGAAYDKMRDKVKAQHKKWLSMRASKEMEELSLTRKQCFKMLRKLFMDSYKGNEELQQKVLQFLDKAHEQLDGQL